MFFYNETNPPTSVSPNGTYYIKRKYTTEIWVKFNNHIELMSIIDIANMDNYWYGIRKTKANDSKLPTRVGSLQMHKDLPVQNGIYRYLATPNGDVKLGNEDSTVDENGNTVAIDGSNGNLLLRVPDFYLKVVDTDEYTEWRISPYALPGFELISVFDIAPTFSTYDNVNNRAATVCSLIWDENEIARDANGFPIVTANAARFRGANNASGNDGTAKSGLGMARTAITSADIINKCKAVGADYHNNSGLAYNALALLYYIEYCNFDIQETYNPILDANGYHQGGLGNGTAVNNTEWVNFNSNYPFVPSFITAKIGNKTGVVSYTIKNWKNTGTTEAPVYEDKVVNVASYRGFELPSEYLVMISSDYAVWHQTIEQGGKSLCYFCNDISKIVVPADNQTTIPYGYELVAELPRTDGYIKSVSPNIHMMPASVGGAANKAYCDYFYTPVDDASPVYGWFSTRFCGLAYTGAAAGWRFALTTYRFAFAYAPHGFRLCREKRKSE